ncbi:MAG: cyclic lactone autoinducer peptide [Lachnospiraceae bacterium]|jgi:cyclic lactone autoinducer peptide|nr:cyclic lactone autoinducer peptide [Lachnospiraceae bacterium]
MKKAIMIAAAKGVKSIAKVSAESTSIFLLYQPHVPKVLKEKELNVLKETR